MVLVVLLTVRRAELDAFRRFERGAAAVMAGHGGRIERVVALAPAPGDALCREVHLVRFPSEQALAAYRQDPALDALRPLRERSVVQTEILAGEDGPDYHAASV